MSFQQDKANALRKPDKSRKGSIDTSIKPLLKLINSHRDYFTTSSCAGRTVLIHLFGPKKNQAKWLFKTHSKVTPEQLYNAMAGFKAKQGVVWLKFEPFILHVRCNGLQPAIKLLKIARDSGLKKSGIIAAGQSYVVEIEGIDRLETPVFKRALLVDKDYLKQLAQEINKKYMNNKKRVGVFFEQLQHLLHG
ncbi:hypothetical protein DRJ48_01105 [Candidatus Woesearchaeota archaeon]|nr:MAG: hypothetical protein DRJ48_01105 [Candidatus Woesearchaeota archaeon]